MQFQTTRKTGDRLGCAGALGSIFLSATAFILAGQVLFIMLRPDPLEIAKMFEGVAATTPIEIAKIIASLSSDASNYILGEIINVSGGR